jgi:recombinational DNA repair protein RecR
MSAAKSSPQLRMPFATDSSHVLPEEGTTTVTSTQICLICAKSSSKTICDACSDRLRGEAVERKRKEEHI